MRYAVVDVELSRPLAGISLSADESGVALLIRRDGRPIAFVMKRLRRGAILAVDEVRRLISEQASPDVLAAAIAEELRGDGRAAPGPVDLTVAVCTHGRTRDLRVCLESLLAIRSGSDSQPHAFELLVVDNAPPDEGTRELVRSLAGVRYVRECVPGLDFARNRALREARGAYVAFLDDDTVADAGWLAGLRDAVADQPDAAVVTGLVLPYELETIAQILFERGGGFRRGFRSLRYAGGRYPGTPFYPLGAGLFGAGANMVVRKDAVLTLGGFDEALDTGASLPGGGDLDIFYRVLRAGYALAYEPRMLVFHKHRRGYLELLRQYRTWGTGLLAFLDKTATSDPAMRDRTRGMRRWWVRYQLRELVKGARRRGPALPDQVAAELVGGLIGMTGAYARSLRRSDRLRRGLV